MMGKIVADQAISTGTTRPEASYAIASRLSTLEGARELLAVIWAALPFGRMPPDLGRVDESWALLRHTQVQALFALDLFERHGGALEDAAHVARCARKLDHDVLDLEYLALATLEGAFATNENKLRKLFRRLCPDSLLLPPESGNSPPKEVVEPSFKAI